MWYSEFLPSAQLFLLTLSLGIKPPWFEDAHMARAKTPQKEALKPESQQNSQT